MVAAQLPAARLLSIFPAGGRAGSELDFTLTSGVDLEGAGQLRFSHPGITAVQKLAPVEGQPTPQPVANQFQVKIAADVPPGLYEVRAAGGAYGVTNPRAFVVSDLAEVAETEPNNSLAQANEVPFGSWINGRSEPGRDVDYFRFAAKAGQKLVFDCWAERIDSRMDATLELYGPDGRQLAQSRDVERHDPVLIFQVPADGQYVLKVFDFQYQGSSEFVYRVSVSDAPHIDFVFPPSGRPGTKATYTLYGANLPGSQPAEGLSIAGRPLEKLNVEIELPADDVSRATRNWEAPVFATEALLDAATYKLASSAGSSNPISIVLAHHDVVAEQEPNDAAPQRVTIPCEIVGQFGKPGDIDVFEFEAHKDQAIWFDVYSHRLGLPTDPLLVLQQVVVDDKGVETVTEVVVQDDPGTNVGGLDFNTTTADPVLRFAHKLPVDGRYRVVLRDLYGENRGGPELFYRMVLRGDEPDFRLIALPEYPLNGQQAPTTWTSRLAKGGTDSLRLYALRKDGFNGEIEVLVEGLPEGVTCPPTYLGPGQSTVSLVFSATEQAADFVGPLKITGRAKLGEQDVVRVARPAAIVWGPATRPTTTRLVRGIDLAVAGTAPFKVDVAPAEITLPQGRLASFDIKATRRGDFAGVLALTPTPIVGVQGEAVSIPADQQQATLFQFFQSDLAPGRYTFVVRSATQVPFTKKPDGSDKQPLNVNDASSPVTVTIVPGPLVIEPQVPNKGEMKAGATIEVPVKVVRRNGFAGPVTLDLLLNGAAGLTAAAVVVPADQDQAKLAIVVAADAAEGPRPHVAVRAVVDQSGQMVELHQLIPVVIQK
jgi:hypothetical protein